MKYEESPTVELKATLLEEVKHEILAFLNAHGGTVYVGLRASVMRGKWRI